MGLGSYTEDFDQWCAEGINRRRWTPKALHLIQDYMPATAYAAHRAGISVVVEQISNSSIAARARFAGHADAFGIPASEFGMSASEATNDQVLRVANYVLAPSQYVIEGLASRCIPDRIVHIPYGVEPEFYLRRSTTPRWPAGVITIAARANSPRKGLHLLVRALDNLLAKDALLKGKLLKVFILGKPSPYGKDLLNKLRAKYRKKLILNARQYSLVEVRNILWNSDIFVMPSLGEGMSFAILEAAAAGLPLAITPYCGIDGFLDECHGILIRDGNVPSVETALTRLLMDPGRAQEMGRAACELARTLTWDRFHSEVSRFYQTRVL